jgi:hypothetical protein
MCEGEVKNQRWNTEDGEDMQEHGMLQRPIVPYRDETEESGSDREMVLQDARFIEKVVVWWGDVNKYQNLLSNCWVGVKWRDAGIRERRQKRPGA